MTTEDLISYIKKQTNNNTSKDLIVSKLLAVGWRLEDVNEAFAVLEKEKLSKINEPSQEKINIEEKPKITEELIPTLVPKTVNVGQPIKEIVPNSQIEIQVPELTSSQDIKKTEIASPEPLQKTEPVLRTTPAVAPVQNTEVPKEVSFNQPQIPKAEIPKAETPFVEAPKVYQVKDLSKVAMVSSYSKDIESMQLVDSMRIPRENNKDVVQDQTKKKSKRWLIFVLVIIFVLGTAFVFASNTFNIRNMKFSLIKKDPKTLLLSNSQTLSSLSSYKTETDVKIYMPSFADISAGLVDGKAILSQDKDSLSINTLGIINQTDNNLMSDNFMTIKSSLLENYISTDIKNNGTSLFISIPDLTQLFGEEAPEVSVIRINEDQSSLISSILPDKVQNRLSKLNLYRILSRSISSYLDKDTVNLYDQFISDADVIEKGEENIKNVDTYHYLVDTNKQLAKKLLSKILDNFTSNLSDADKVKIAEIAGATTINSFEVWVGKNDNNIYQYRVVLAVPLSKVIDFEDESIGDNTVNIDWQTTYYDFGISNNIFMPEEFTTIDNFVKNTDKNKIKNEVSSLKQYANSLRNVEGSYGLKSNTKGNCMSPVSGSLFSPTGHSKSAIDSVSSISLLLNKILSKTNGAGTCYSTPQAWSFTVPIADNYFENPTQPGETYQSYYCVDNTGATKDLTAPPSGVVCK